MDYGRNCIRKSQQPETNHLKYEGCSKEMKIKNEIHVRETFFFSITLFEKRLIYRQKDKYICVYRKQWDTQ